MQQITVGIVGANRITVGPTVVASEMGCFREEGLDVKLLEVGGRRESIPKLMTGELDVCLAGPLSPVPPTRPWCASSYAR